MRQKLIAILETNVYECFVCGRYCTEQYAIRYKNRSGGRGKIGNSYICKSCYDLVTGVEKGVIHSIKQKDSEFISIKKEAPHQSDTTHITNDIVSLLARNVKGGQNEICR